MGGGGKGSTQTVQQTQFDPLYPGSGGSDVRNDVYGRRSGLSGNWAYQSQVSQSELQNQANDNYWLSTAYPFFKSQTAGSYLGGSPQLTNQINTLRQQSLRELGDTQADIKARYARTGQAVSTGVTQQLLQSGAAARARSDADQAAIIGQNYVRERDFQNRSPSSAEAVSYIPSNLRAQGVNVTFDPLTKSAQLATALSGGASTNNPTVIQKPGALDYALGFTSAAG